MTEQTPSGPTPEEQAIIEQEREGEARCAQWLLDHPEPLILPEDVRDCGPEVAELEEKFTLFEAEYSLVDLLLIVDLTEKDAPKHPLRGPAKIALDLINFQPNRLKRETNISPEKLEELKAKYKTLSQAIGIISNLTNKVDHNR